MRVIVVTKNLAYERELQQDLQRLDYEVFVTRNAGKESVLRAGAAFFDGVILSETISEKECVAICREAADVYKRKLIRLLPENSSGEKEPLAVAYVRRSFVELRDFLATWVSVAAVEEPLPDRPFSQEVFSRFLSPTERRFFEQLNEDTVISRQELCWNIWGEPATPSRKVQLSTIVKQLNRKLEKYGQTSKRVQTHWGKGYILE